MLSVLKGVEKMSKVKIQFDPAFVEEAVFLKIKSLGDQDPLTKLFHHAREQIYEDNQSLEGEGGAFHKFYKNYFIKMGIQAIFEGIFMESPMLYQSNLTIFVRKVWETKQEGAELYRLGAFKTVYVGLKAVRILDRDFLQTLLRHEMMHVSDMLDPEFCYSPSPEFKGKSEVENDLIRERFAFLWDTYIDARLRCNGWPPVVTVDKRKTDFERLFSLWDHDYRNKIYEEITRKNNLTQRDLLNFASDRCLTKPLGQGGLRCPLCDCLTHEPITQWAQENVSVIDEIKKYHPNWDPSLGSCLQCLEIYGSFLMLKGEK